jgi:hypothetical protein
MFVQLYYELEEERERLGAQDVALVRVEQLCPFPYDLFLRELNRYPSKSFGAILVLVLCSSSDVWPLHMLGVRYLCAAQPHSW